MADKPKFKDKPSPAKAPNPVMPVIVILVTFTLLAAITVKLQSYVSERESLGLFLHKLWLFLNGDATLTDVFGATGSTSLITFFFILKIFSIVFSIAMVWFIFSTLQKLTKANKILRKDLYPSKEIEESIETEGAPIRYVNPKWQKVTEHINSKNPSDWKLAILEADIILDEMLDKMGYHGETMGEKLKMIEPSDFTSLGSAWEAHKIRNLIAHEGSDFLINEREAQRVIRLFQEVFEEFKYI